MDNVTILATIAAIAAAFVIQALINLSPVIWKPVELQAGAPCAGVGLKIGCVVAGLRPESPGQYSKGP